MHRMIRPLLQRDQRLDLPVEMACTLLHGFQQRGARHVIRARTRDQNPVFRQHLHSELVEPAIREPAFREILLALDERGRIKNDDIEALARFAKSLQLIECIGAYGAHAISEPVALGIASDRIDRSLRCIDANDFRRAQCGGTQAPRAEITEHVEHALAFHEARESIAIFALIVEPAGFLTADRIDLEFETAFAHQHRSAGVAVAEIGIARQMFQRAHRCIVLPASWRGLSTLTIASVIESLIRSMPAVVICADENVAETVQRQARQRNPIRRTRPDTTVPRRAAHAARARCWRRCTIREHRADARGPA